MISKTKNITIFDNTQTLEFHIIEQRESGIAYTRQRAFGTQPLCMTAQHQLTPHINSLPVH